VPAMPLTTSLSVPSLQPLPADRSLRRCALRQHRGVAGPPSSRTDIEWYQCQRADVSSNVSKMLALCDRTTTASVRIENHANFADVVRSGTIRILMDLIDNCHSDPCFVPNEILTLSACRRIVCMLSVCMR